MVSIGFGAGMGLKQIAALVDAEGDRGADIIALPELPQGQSTPETLDGPTIRTLAGLASKHRTYVVCPIDRIEHTRIEDNKAYRRRFNSAVLLDRRGEIAGIYDKVHPHWYSECVKEPPVSPGDEACVFTTDFGRVGIAICFDVNWPDLWRRMAERGAEMVIWPSAYSAGVALQAHAIQNHYYIVSATWCPECSIYDIDGERIVFDRNNRGDGLNVTRATLDLDRCIFHYDRNDQGPDNPSRLQALLQNHASDVVVDKRLPQEAWFVLKAKSAGASARDLAGRYGLEELRHYLNRADREIERIRDAADLRIRPSVELAAGDTARR